MAYQVTISDPNNAVCDTTINVVIGNSNGPRIVILNTSPATCTDTDGTASLSPATFTYSWRLNGIEQATGANPANLAAGTYEVIAEDLNGCTQTLLVEIESITTLEATLEILSQSDCGENNGVARLTITNGSGNYDTGTWGSDATQTNLASGAYEYLITDTNTGCELMVDFVMTDKVDSATVTITNITPVSCLGSTDASVMYDLNPERWICRKRSGHYHR